MLATIMAALAAIPEIVKVLGEVVAEIKTLRQSSIDASLDQIRKDVSATIFEIQNAKTNEDRARLATALNARISK